MTFRFQALDASGHAVQDLIQAGSPDEAARLLHARGLLVTRLREEAADARAAETATRPENASTGGRVRWKNVVYFTQQMAMLLSSGARMVPALRALEAQSRNDPMRALIRHLRTRVEDGAPLSAALADRPDIFDGVYRSLTASGESTGRMAEAFQQMAGHTRHQQEIRQRLLGAAVYPAILILMCGAVLIGMFGFVLPRFRELFTVLGADLPASTRLMMGVSGWLGAHWALPPVALALGIAAAFAFLRSPAGRRWWAGTYTRLPLAGELIRRLILARIFRIWGTLLSNNVGLIDALRLARETTRSTAFHTLLDRIQHAVSEGRQVGAALQDSSLVPPTLAAAVATGEESGRLALSLLFVADSLESENAQLAASLSRIIEPVILLVMGVAVGFVAVSLFMPLFDIATLAGGG